jgi:hypothetical protein
MRCVHFKNAVDVSEQRAHPNKVPSHGDFGTEQSDLDNEDGSHGQRFLLVLITSALLRALGNPL